MAEVAPELVAEVRAASRALVREWEFLNRTLAGTDLSASAVHALVEIGAAGRLTAKDLSARLLLEKSTISRLVAALVAHGELREVAARDDKRRKDLFLTARGERTLAAVTRFAETQVADALAPLPPAAQRNIERSLRTYAGALKAGRTATAAPSDRPEVREGYIPGLVGRIAEMHAVHYSRTMDFGAAFETKVAGGLAEFVTRLSSPANGLWHAAHDGRVVGSIAIDGEDLGEDRAHLRWFIVDAGRRGTGFGAALIERAVAFCDERAFAETHLWTLASLDAARRLYERHGFVLAEEYEGDQWGRTVLEQRFVRPG